MIWLKPIVLEESFSPSYWQKFNSTVTDGECMFASIHLCLYQPDQKKLTSAEIYRFWTRLLSLFVSHGQTYHYSCYYLQLMFNLLNWLTLFFGISVYNFYITNMYQLNNSELLTQSGILNRVVLSNFHVKSLSENFLWDSIFCF